MQLGQGRGLDLKPILIRTMLLPSHVGANPTDCLLAELRAFNMLTEALPLDLPCIQIMDSDAARDVVHDIRNSSTTIMQRKFRGVYATCGK